MYFYFHYKLTAKQRLYKKYCFDFYLIFIFDISCLCPYKDQPRKIVIIE